MNARKTKTMIVSRSRIMHPQSPLLSNGGTVLKGSDDETLGVTFDSKMTFEKHLNSLGFQSNFSKASYLDEVLASIS